MVFGVFLNNQYIQQATLLPNGQYGTTTRYIFISGRDVPIIIQGETSTGSQSWAVGIDDGTNDHYQIGYEGQGDIQVTLEEQDSTLQYTVSSGFATATKTL